MIRIRDRNNRWENWGYNERNYALLTNNKFGPDKGNDVYSLYNEVSATYVRCSMVAKALLVSTLF